MEALSRGIKLISEMLNQREALLHSPCNGQRLAP